jgi:hypothetical protein
MRRSLGLWIVLIAACLAGCGHSDNISVTGVLLKGGEMYKPAEGRKLALYFHPIKDDTPGSVAGEVEMADYDARDGSFTVPGREGDGIPPGKYRIAVVESLRREQADKANKAPKAKRGPRRIDNDTNFLESTFGERTSPFVRDLRSSTTLTLDMAKPTDSP